MTYHEHIDVLTRLCQTQKGDIQGMRLKVEDLLLSRAINARARATK
jgi:hypothetical protein